MKVISRHSADLVVKNPLIAMRCSSSPAEIDGIRKNDTKMTQHDTLYKVLRGLCEVELFENRWLEPLKNAESVEKYKRQLAIANCQKSGAPDGT